MADEVDRLLIWMRRVEHLEDQLEKTDPAEQRPLRAELERAARSQRAALTALVAAANDGDPEALVALDALESEAEEKTSVSPRSAA